MSLTIKVKPAAGRIVPQPEKSYQPMPAEGGTVILDTYYSAALRFGDIIEVVDETPAALQAPVVPAPAPAVAVAPVSDNTPSKAAPLSDSTGASSK